MSVEKIRGNINSNTKSSTMAKIEGTALEDNLFVASDLNVYAKANYHQNLTTLF
ncbi:hypothetical protein L915_02667 [Phytophthora nicotianae]|uniref:Uncharacterized protein n=1 Tax=Phytophthora nicotianae TaxID=4792 RepID=W2HIB7_PHYNI|nr:hypothetical protein L915_02667 [Phytophthora nicotianae]